MFITSLLLGSVTVALQAQCETWNGSPKEEEATNAHVLYRQFVKGQQISDIEELSEENFKIAFTNWQKAYELAPAADGQRPSHYSDGRLFYKVLANRTDDPAKKKEYMEMVMRLYDEQIQCYKNEEFLLGRKAFDMFYSPVFGYSDKTLETFKLAFEKGGKNSEYILLEPLAQLLAYMYENKKIGQKETQDLYNKAVEIADYNVENNKQYGQYYDAAKIRMTAHFAQIEDEVFDCSYFKEKLIPIYMEKSDSLDIIRYVYNKLKTQGCDTTETIMVEMRDKYLDLASEINVQLELERRSNNPCYDAAQLQKEGDYRRAMARYEECLSQTTDSDGKAQVYYSIAFIQTWQYGQYSEARENARRAAGLKPGWGKPYILIGDMYAKSSRSCGDDWDSRMAILAAIDKYAYARSIDREVADEANKRIGQYSSAIPERQDGFMRGVKEGQSVRVGCWIGETVQVRYK
jgi:tetratricopeptide (TPR) repeat protein